MKRLASLLLLISLLSGCVLPNVDIAGASGRNPFKCTGNTVLLTYDEANKSNLPRSQMAMIDSPTLRAYLKEKCVKNAAGVPQWRIWPSSTDPKNDDPVWAGAKASCKEANYLTVSNGKTGTAVKLPASEAEAMVILKKYLGK